MFKEEQPKILHNGNWLELIWMYREIKDTFSWMNSICNNNNINDLVSTLGVKKLKLCKSYIEGIYSDILQVIETKVKNTSSYTMIWIRGSPSVGKSVLAASILTQLQDQNRYVISFWFYHTQSTMIATDSLWHVVACDLFLLYPSFRWHLVKHHNEHSSSNIDHLFKNLIETPLSSLDDVPYKELLVIVINILDECSGLRGASCAHLSIGFRPTTWTSSSKLLQVNQRAL